MADKFGGPVMSILKFAYPCFNSAKISLFLYSFLSVNAQLLIAYSTAFYAIMYKICFSTKIKKYF